MATVIDDALHKQLLERREKLQAAQLAFASNDELTRLLGEVDAALARMNGGTYGLCEVCHDPVEAERLLADPLVRFCFGHLTPCQQQALEEDLELAVRIQRGLLPHPCLHLHGWEIAYHYEPSGLVSGDYCDLIATEDGDFYFIFGDVSGKGVAASMLMAHLNAMFRSLIPIGLPLEELMARASRVFCESTLSTHYATLICGKAKRGGEVELCNAGHLPPLLLQRGAVLTLDSTGLPVGVFCDEQFEISRISLGVDAALLLYTDGITETQDPSGTEYGVERLSQAVKTSSLSPEELVRKCVDDVTRFRGGQVKADDLTIMAIKRLK